MIFALTEAFDDEFLRYKCENIVFEGYGSHKLPDLGIYNMHEHLQHDEDALRILMDSMNDTDTKAIVLLGSPKETLIGGSRFTDYDINNEYIMDLQEKMPNKIFAFPTIYPKDPEKLEKLKNLTKNAAGIKMYSGHSMFYDYPLDAEDMRPIYAYLEENKIPLLWHVNPSIKQIRKEFETVLKDFPNLTIICPHFCLSTLDTNRLKHYLDTYPNFYIDFSFGRYIEPFLERISNNPKKYRDIIYKYPDRIFFGTDAVITDDPRKTAEWFNNITQCYIDMLEKPYYKCSAEPDVKNKCWKGLDLDKEVLKKIYEETPKKFLGIK